MGGMADVDYTSLQILHELPSSVGKNIMKKHTQIIKNLRQSQLANLEQNQGLEDSLSLENLKVRKQVVFCKDYHPIIGTNIYFFVVPSGRYLHLSSLACAFLLLNGS